jgi:hypothetical protein
MANDWYKCVHQTEYKGSQQSIPGVIFQGRISSVTEKGGEEAKEMEGISPNDIIQTTITTLPPESCQATTP